MLEEPELATLIARTAQGDRAAFRRLYDGTSGRLLAITLKILGRRDLAEEALQDSYVSVWKRASGFDAGRGSARGWLATIARRRAIDRLRSSPWLFREVPEPPEIAASVSRLPERMTLRHCLERLDARTRHAICLAYLYGMTHSELSGKTGIPLGTIKSRLRRGVKSVKECLEQ